MTLQSKTQNSLQTSSNQSLFSVELSDLSSGWHILHDAVYCHIKEFSLLKFIIFRMADICYLKPPKSWTAWKIFNKVMCISFFFGIPFVLKPCQPTQVCFQLFCLIRSSFFRLEMGKAKLGICTYLTLST